MIFIHLEILEPFKKKLEEVKRSCPTLVLEWVGKSGFSCEGCQRSPAMVGPFLASPCVFWHPLSSPPERESPLPLPSRLLGAVVTPALAHPGRQGLSCCCLPRIICPLYLTDSSPA